MNKLDLTKLNTTKQWFAEPLRFGVGDQWVEVDGRWA